MHKELRGIRAIDADCNRRLHLKGVAGIRTASPKKNGAAISRRVTKMADYAPLIRPTG
jgi:hypothetical protein